MKREEIQEKLNSVFREIFDDESITVCDDMTAADISGWDSLTHITLIAEIEDLFDIKLPMKKIVGMKNVGEMITAIQEELAE